MSSGVKSSFTSKVCLYSFSLIVAGFCEKKVFFSFFFLFFGSTATRVDCGFGSTLLVWRVDLLMYVMGEESTSGVEKVFSLVCIWSTWCGESTTVEMFGSTFSWGRVDSVFSSSGSSSVRYV